jgi:uncharacterized membrane protein YgcG
MHCPFCQAPVFEAIAQCTSCGFSLDRVEAFFGEMPRLEAGVSDLAGLFRPGDARRIAEASARLHERFPQVTCSIVTTSLEPSQPLTAYAFWLFNRAGIFRDMQRGSKSRGVLLALDAANARASLMIGYGLEPFVSQEDLREIIDEGAPHFARQFWVEGIVTVLARTTARLSEIVARIGETYGLEMSSVQSAESTEVSVAEQREPGVY